MPHHEHEGLTAGQIQDFISNGFVRLDNAFSADLAERLGLPSREGLPEGALILPLPRGVGAARVTDGQLVHSP